MLLPLAVYRGSVGRRSPHGKDIMSQTWTFLTGTRIEIVADTLEEAERLIALGEYEEIEAETILLEVSDVE